MSITGPHPEADELQRLYEDRFSGRTEYRNEVWKILTSEFFSKWIPASSTVLDLGAGYCEFINNVSAQRKMALDLNPDAKLRANENVELILHDCSLPWPVPENSIDVVFTSNFLEHLFDKATVVETAKQAFRALKPGGRILCLGPNVRFVGGAYWDYFDHHVALTERSVSEVLEQAGFVVEEAIDRFLPYSMSEGWQPPVQTLSWYLKLRPAWKIAGKQFFVVAKKN
jgi:SAM-dependent methyltransferase